MSRRADDLQILFVGCGAATQMHSRTLRGVRGLQLHYASRRTDRAEAFRRQFSGAGQFTDYERAMESDVDVVVVATPTASHRALAEYALRSGKDVIVEKPAFMRSPDAREVRVLAASCHRRVLVAENYFYKPVARYLRRTIGLGDLGEQPVPREGRAQRADQLHRLSPARGQSGARQRRGPR